MVPAVFVELLSIRIGSPLSAESVTRSEKSCSFDCQSEPPTLYQARTRACHATHKMSRTHLLHQPLSEWRVLDNILGSEYMFSGFADRSRSVHRGPTLKLAAEATKSGGSVAPRSEGRGVVAQCTVLPFIGGRTACPANSTSLAFRPRYRIDFEEPYLHVLPRHSFKH